MILFAKSLMDYIISKYSLFNSLNAHHKVVSLFNSIDAFICKKLGSFIYEAFALRNESIDTGIVFRYFYTSVFFSFLFSTCNTICNWECKQRVVVVVIYSSQPINPFIPNSDKHLFSPYNIPT